MTVYSFMYFDVIFVLLKKQTRFASSVLCGMDLWNSKGKSKSTFVWQETVKVVDNLPLYFNIYKEFSPYEKAYPSHDRSLKKTEQKQMGTATLNPVQDPKIPLKTIKCFIPRKKHLWFIVDTMSS